jgi:uncharacterized lipoprotein YajG
MRYFYNILIILALSMILACCATFETNKNTSSTCRKLKRQMIFNKHNNNSEASWTTRDQNERIRQLYKENNCDKQ